MLPPFCPSSNIRIPLSRISAKPVKIAHNINCIQFRALDGHGLNAIQTEEIHANKGRKYNPKTVLLDLPQGQRYQE